jgi:iron complex transport system substrate-binding protein
VPIPRPVPRAVFGVLLAVLVLVGAACTSANTGPSASADASAAPSLAIASATSSPTPVATASATPAPAFPATLTDDEGTAVTITSKPTKIVSLTPANTEILFAIGAGDRVIATDDSSDYPAAAKPLPDVATFQSVDVEKIVSLGADLVVAGGLGFNPPDDIAKLRSLGIPVIVLYAPSLDGVYQDIDLVGAATGESDGATKVTDDMRAQIDAISAVTQAGSKPRVYYEVGYTDATGEIFAPADQSFVAEMVNLAGGTAITTGDPNSYSIALEKLIEQDPQVIILGVNPFYSPTPASVKARAGWDVMTAVKDDQIRTVTDTEITRPGPRLPTGLRNLALAITPDVQLPAAP